MSSYFVPAGRVRVEYRQSNSVFIATLDRASSAEEARALLREIREEMPGATHHVHAMKIGHGASVIEGASDDGEPPGTSGPPALAVLRGSDLGDAMLVITRFFGGTKLGTGGLVQAYTAAAKEAVAAVRRELKVTRIAIRMTTAYPLYERVRALVEEGGGLVDGEDFSDVVELRARYPRDGIAALEEALREASSGAVTIRRAD